MRLPDGAVVLRQRGRFAEHVRAAGDREAGREGIAQASVGGAVPALAQLSGGADGVLESARRGAVVVGDTVHEHGPDGRADAVLLCCSEAGVGGVRPDRGVSGEGGGAGRSHGPIHLRRQLVRGSHIEGPLQGEDVALQPGQEIHAGAQAGGRDLWDVDMGVDEPRHDHQGAQIDRGLRHPGRIGGSENRADAAGDVDLDDAVGQPQEVAIWQGAQQACS